MITVCKIIKDEDFRSIRDAWNKLLSRSSSDTLFLSWEWLFTWWDSYKDREKELFILLLHENNKLIGIAPLMRHRSTFLRIFSIQKIGLLGSGEVCSDYLDIIALSGKEKIVVSAVFRYLRSCRDAWDVLSFSDILEGADSARHISIRAKESGYSVSIENGAICPYIDLPGDRDSLYQSLSKKFRKSIEYKRRHLLKEHNVAFVHCLEKIGEGMDCFIRLHQKRWQGRGYRKTGSFSSEKFTRFHRNIAQALFKKGILRLTFLLVDNKPVAGQYNFIYNRSYMNYLPGFDPDWSKLNVGHVLLSYCVEDAIGSGCKEFDFVRGDESFKFDWTNLFRKTICIVVCNGGVKSKMYQLCRRSARLMAKIIKSTVGKIVPETVLHGVRRKITTGGV